MITLVFLHCIYIGRLYSVYILYSNSKTLNLIKVRRQRSNFRDNVLRRKVVGKNGFIVDSISTDSVLCVFYSMLYFVEFSGKYHGKCLPILYAYLKPKYYLQISDEPFPKVSSLPMKAYRRTFNFLEAIFSQLFHSSCDPDLDPFLDYKLEDQADLTTRFS